MSSEPTSRINNKVDFKSCFGIAIGAFLIATIIVGAVGLLLVNLIAPDCWETCPLTVLTISPWIGGVIAVVAGIIGGQKAYKEKEKYLQMSKKVKTRSGKLHNATETAKILHGFLKLSAFCSACGFRVLSQKAKYCPNCERKFM